MSSLFFVGLCVCVWEWGGGGGGMRRCLGVSVCVCVCCMDEVFQVRMYDIILYFSFVSVVQVEVPILFVLKMPGGKSTFPSCGL